MCNLFNQFSRGVGLLNFNTAKRQWRVAIIIIIILAAPPPPHDIIILCGVELQVSATPASSEYVTKFTLAPPIRFGFRFGYVATSLNRAKIHRQHAFTTLRVYFRKITVTYLERRSARLENTPRTLKIRFRNYRSATGSIDTFQAY